MQNYLNNNLTLIKEYCNVYKNEININTIIGQFKSGELINHNGFDYGRFRVFLDSCLLLLNKEKLNYYYKNKYNYKGFFDELSNDKELENYLKFIKDEKISSNISDNHIYFSLDGKEKTPWDQVATIRNAMAHMQYGQFMQQKSGLLLYYFLYNKDKGIRKDWGIVFEPVLHKFIQVFFSNYSFGITFKSTFFSKYSLAKGKQTWTLNYYEITCKSESLEIYNGYNTNLISEFNRIMSKEKDIFAFIVKHKEEFNIKEMSVKNNINMRRYKKFANKSKLYSDEEYIYGLKTLFDFETELSNFLVHIGQLNETLYEYCIIRDCGNFTSTDMEKYKSQLEEKLLELREDTNAKLAFDLGFTYLKTMNFVLRIEDDDFKQFDYESINVSMFTYEKSSFNRYVLENGAKKNQLQRYITERMRNALMHGNINISINIRNEVIVFFNDIYNKREEKIGISLDELKIFLLQESIYSGIPKETVISIIQ